ncbi:MAG TPA: hypothetical protein VG796_08455 [Verrucomicrobiales bacterium]|nr:hypothetical protein [Verrucomicrobiales bacterium]
MPDDPDSAPERPETVPEPPPLAPADQRAVEVAVAGAAGFLLGRVLFGNAGGMAAGLLAAGAGLLMKHLSHGKNGESASPALEPEPSAPPPAESPGVHEDFDVAGVREVFEGTAFAAGSATGGTASFSDSDAGVFAEEPAWFEPPEKEAAVPSVESMGAVPAADLERISFDDNPEPVRVELLPVVPPVEETPEKEVLPEENILRPYTNGQVPPVPVMETAATGAVPELPAEFTALREEEEPGPREEFLIIPDEPSSYPPPLQPVVAELNRLLERSIPPEPPARESLTAGVPVAERSVPGPPAVEPWAIEPPVPEQPAQPFPAHEALPEPAAEFHIPELPPLAPPVMEAPSPEPVPVEPPAVEPWAMEIPVREVPEPVAPPAPMAMPELPPMAPVASAPLPELTPAPAPVMPATAEKAEIPSNPEEIWRQAAVELAAMRNAPPAPSEEESPWAAMLAQAPAPAPPRPPAGLSTPPPLSPPNATPAGPEEIPPWLRDIAYGEAQETPANPDPQRAFLASGGLTMPVPLPPVPAPQKPPSEAVFAPANPGVTRPVPAVPSDALLDLDAPVPAIPPIPVAPVPITSATSPAGEAMPSQLPRAPVAAGMGPAAAADEEKLFVPRVRSRRSEPAPRRRSVVTPFRVAVLALIAAAALAMAFKPQLTALWEQKILGRPAKNAQTVPPKPVPAAKNETGVATDVKITDEDPLQPESVPPPPAPEAAPGKPEGGSPKSNSTPVKPEAPAPPPPPTEPPAAPPPSAAAADPQNPAPGETEARALISRLLQAKTAAEVKPYILNVERVGPAVDASFEAGKTTATVSHEATLTGAEKSGGLGRMVWSFKVTTDKVPSGFPVAVEDTPGGLRVDWEFLTQCRDERLRGFLDDPSAAPADFYVSLVRTHPFPDMLPEQDLQNFIPFTVASPSVGSARTNVFIRKGTLLGTKADGLYKWGIEYAPIVTLTHKDGHVEITGVPKENWRAAGQLKIGGVRDVPKNE